MAGKAARKAAIWAASRAQAKGKRAVAQEYPPVLPSAEAMHSLAAVARPAARKQFLPARVVHLAAGAGPRKPRKAVGSAASRPHQIKDTRQQQLSEQTSGAKNPPGTYPISMLSRTNRPWPVTHGHLPLDH